MVDWLPEFLYKRSQWWSYVDFMLNYRFTSQKRNYANLSLWLRAYHSGKSYRPCLYTDDPIVPAFDLIDRLRRLQYDITWSEVEPFLEIWKKSAANDSVDWA